MFQFIQQQQDLAVLLTQMEQCSTYALDTEFIKVDTLYPKLRVCQINLNGQVSLLDGTALDLAHFWQKYLTHNRIFSMPVVKILT